MNALLGSNHATILVQVSSCAKVHRLAVGVRDLATHFGEDAKAHGHIVDDLVIVGFAQQAVDDVQILEGGQQDAQPLGVDAGLLDPARGGKAHAGTAQDAESSLPSLTKAIGFDQFNQPSLSSFLSTAWVTTRPSLLVMLTTLVFNPALSHGLSDDLSFEGLSDLESEDKFVNSFVNIGEPGAPPTVAPHSCNSHKDKCQKRSSDDHAVAPIMTTTASDADITNSQGPISSESPVTSEFHGSSGSDIPPPVNPRGRKQPLTEDLSKTFVCDLCNRRFRRQEHLKRHYRSLHTQEKPFECNQCDKRFSRSDKLTQHTRTHAGGVIVMSLVEDGEVPSFDASGTMGAPATDDYTSYGKVLFQIAFEVPGSASELSSEETSDQGKKKRKRSD